MLMKFCGVFGSVQVTWQDAYDHFLASESICTYCKPLSTPPLVLLKLPVAWSGVDATNESRVIHAPTPHLTSHPFIRGVDPQRLAG